MYSCIKFGLLLYIRLKKNFIFRSSFFLISVKEILFLLQENFFENLMYFLEIQEKIHFLSVFKFRIKFTPMKMLFVRCIETFKKKTISQKIFFCFKGLSCFLDYNLFIKNRNLFKIKCL